MWNAPLIPLGELLRRREPDVQVIATETYEFAGVKSFGRGLFKSGRKNGSEFAYKRLSRLHANQFVYPKLMAWEGALAVTSQAEAGLVVSPEFCVFDIDTSKLHPAWISYYFRQPSIWPTLSSDSAGTNIRRKRIYPDDFLRYRMPVPSIEQQTRLVEAIESQLSKLSEVNGLRNDVDAEYRKLLIGIELQLWPESAIKAAPTLADVTTFLARGRQSEQGDASLRLIKTQHVQMGKLLPTQMRLSVTAAQKVSPEAIVHEGDSLIACSAAGCLGRVALFSGLQEPHSVDTHIAIARARQEVVDPKYLFAYLRGAQGQYQLRSREQGDWQREKVSFRLTELNVASLRAVPIPVPSLSTQLSIVSTLDRYYGKIELVSGLASGQQEELKALIPAILAQACRGEL